MGKKVIILRGISGSGKSSFIKGLYNPKIVSADEFFLEPAPNFDYGLVEDGLIDPPHPVVRKSASEVYFYVFKPALIGQAHAWCFGEFINALHSGAETVVVDNTNIHVWEFENYIHLAGVMDYEVEVKTFKPVTLEEVRLCAERNSHNVPADVIMKMAFEFEDGFLFALTYGLDVDWVKNLVASDSGTLEYRGEKIGIHNIRHTSYDDVREAFPFWFRKSLNIISVEHCLIVERK